MPSILTRQKFVFSFALLFMLVITTAQIQLQERIALPIDIRFSMVHHIPLSDGELLSAFSGRSCGLTHLIKKQHDTTVVQVTLPFVTEALAKDELDRIWILSHTGSELSLIQINEQLQMVNQIWIPFHITPFLPDVHLVYNGQWGLLIDHQCWIQHMESDDWIALPIHDEVLKMIPGPNQGSWIVQTDKEVYICESSTSCLLLYKDSIIRTIMLSVEGDLWILGRSRLFKLDLDNQTIVVWSSLHNPSGLYALHPIGDELLLLHSSSHLLWQQYFRIPTQAGGTITPLQIGMEALPLFFPKCVSWNWELWIIGYNQYTYEVRKLGIDDISGNNSTQEEILPAIELLSAQILGQTNDSLEVMLSISLNCLKDIPLNYLEMMIKEEDTKICSGSPWYKCPLQKDAGNQYPIAKINLTLPKDIQDFQSTVELEIFSINGKAYYPEKPIRISIPYNSFVSSAYPSVSSNKTALMVYPNPVTNTLFITGAHQHGQILIQSLDQRVMKKIDIRPDQVAVIDVSDLRYGQYLLHYQSATASTSGNALILKVD
jgi:hypothetical protein